MGAKAKTAGEGVEKMILVRPSVISRLSAATAGGQQRRRRLPTATSAASGCCKRKQTGKQPRRKKKNQVDPFPRPHTAPRFPTAGGKPPRGVQGHQEAAQEADSSSTGGGRRRGWRRLASRGDGVAFTGRQTAASEKASKAVEGHQEKRPHLVQTRHAGLQRQIAQCPGAAGPGTHRARGSQGSCRRQRSAGAGLGQRGRRQWRGWRRRGWRGCQWCDGRERARGAGQRGREGQGSAQAHQEDWCRQKAADLDQAHPRAGVKGQTHGGHGYFRPGRARDQRSPL